MYKWKNVESLVKAYYEIDKSLTKDGYISFSGALSLVNQLLAKDDGEKIDVISSLKKRYKYFLIDESQDTEIAQYELFFRITNKVNQKDFLNGEKDLHPVNLLCVSADETSQIFSGGNPFPPQPHDSKPDAAFFHHPV